MEIGTFSPYSCPECKGVLSTITEGRLTRYRCHTGHAYTAKTLMESLNINIEENAYNTLRAVEEKLTLLKEMIRQEVGKGNNISRLELQMQVQQEKTELLHRILSLEK